MRCLGNGRPLPGQMAGNLLRHQYQPPHSDGYRQYLNCYVIPAVRNVELQKLTPRQIQDI